MTRYRVSFALRTWFDAGEVDADNMDEAIRLATIRAQRVVKKIPEQNETYLNVVSILDCDESEKITE